MTTIVYKEGILAADTGVVFTGDNSVEKGFLADKLGIGFCEDGRRFFYGVGGDGQTIAIENVFKNGRVSFIKPNKITDKEIFGDFSGLIARPTEEEIEVYYFGCSNKIPYWQIKCDGSFAAIGSGRAFALGAFEQGASAIDALKTTIKWDTNTFGNITYYSVNSSKPNLKMIKL